MTSNRVHYSVLLLASFVSASVFSAEPQIRIELAEGASLTATTVETIADENNEGEEPATPKPSKFLRNDGFIRFGAGLGYRVQRKDVQTQGPNAQILAYGQLAGFGDGYGNVNEKWRVLGHVRGTFNIANKEVNGPRNLSSGIDFDHNTMIGFSPIGSEKGADFFIGASGNVTGGWNFYSRLQDHVNGSGGIDTGLITQGSVVSTIITGSVSAGGQACQVELPNGEVQKFTTDAWGFGGQLNVFVGDKIYLNARYINYPKQNNADFSDYSGFNRSGSLIKGMIAIELSDKLTLSGNCQIVNMVKQSSVEGPKVGGNTSYVAGPQYSVTTQLFQLGIIRRFASGDK